VGLWARVKHPTVLAGRHWLRRFGWHRWGWAFSGDASLTSCRVEFGNLVSVFAKHFVDCVVVKLRVPDPWYLELFRETRSRVPGKFFGK
jgi:hypothetical protein